MSRFSLLFVATALSAAACAAPSESSTSTDGSAITTTRGGHHAAVAACDAAHDSAAQNAMSTLAMIVAEQDWQGCLGLANDAAIATIESNLVDATSHYAGQTQRAFDDARADAEALCVEEDKASLDFGGTLALVERAACRASREHFLGLLVDDFVSFGNDPHPIPEAREAHPQCYVAHDAAIGSATSTVEMMQATFGLADCVTAEAKALAGAIADIQVENDASFGPASAAKARIAGAVDDLVSHGTELCALLNEAGENGIGSLSRVTTGTCTSRIAESGYSDLHLLQD